MPIDYDKWKDTNIEWVCGGIDHSGHVIGHYWDPLDDETESIHTVKEKAITSWRWNVARQCFMADFIPPKRRMLEEEWTKVAEWLVKQGYADDSIFEKEMIRRIRKNI